MDTNTMNGTVAAATDGRAGTVAALPLRRPSLAFFHPSPKGNGGAARFQLHPAHDDTEGSIWLTCARQMTVGDRHAPVPTFPRFDWENRLTVKLGFNDLCKMLQVFRGECESIDEGRGLYHRTAKAMTKIVLKHTLDPIPGYSLDVYRTATGGAETSTHMFFSPAEALGICEAITGSMSVISFGIPVVIPRDTSAYVAEQREMRDATAA